MPPTLRSSPQKSRSSDTTGDETVSSMTTQNTTPRKVPHCTKCGRPRAGHPRQGCPFSDSPQATTPKQASSKPALTAVISAAFEELHIEQATPTRASLSNPKEATARTVIRGRRSLGQQASPMPSRADEQDTQAAIRSRRKSALPDLGPSQSLQSVSTTTGEILDKLTFLPDDSEDESKDGDEPAAKELKEKVVRWQDTLATTPAAAKGKGKGRASMPGTLMTPSPYSSMNINETQDTKPSDRLTQDVVTSLSSIDSQSTAVPLAGLVRTMSMEERSNFVDFITNTPEAAQVYRLPKADIPAIKKSATVSGYFALTVDIVNDSQGGELEEGYLVLGKDDRAVRRLMQSVYYDELKKSGGGKSSLKAAAGGAMVGAVATFTGLAFV
ncbi:hypothetical protein PC9H_004730 [Pleurotus ostreatus]|uniref:Uncharacterized protein n=1 Tax=Pleurotus ostreatus TaxID=5322 RepID=A0A8H7DTN0_PLEOS|nr:uncharacterized protein PC9H_004730 [Pleurotus ostreatus]KAF7432787.1 hypothetical protein PC9H_004730 [Pleurotus ostreatus]